MGGPYKTLATISFPKQNVKKNKFKGQGFLTVTCQHGCFTEKEKAEKGLLINFLFTNASEEKPLQFTILGLDTRQRESEKRYPPEHILTSRICLA